MVACQKSYYKIAEYLLGVEHIEKDVVDLVRLAHDTNVFLNDRSVFHFSSSSSVGWKYRVACYLQERIEQRRRNKPNKSINGFSELPK